MPINIEFNEENKLITFTVTGNPMAEDFADVIKGIYARPDYLHYTRNLWDMCEMDFTLSKSENVRRFPSLLMEIRPNREGQTTKSALVVNGKLAYGMSRMFEMSSDIPDLKIKVFESMDEARDWLL